MIEIYGQHDCQYCMYSKKLCEEQKLDYKYFDVGTDITINEFKEMFPDTKTAPQIKVDGVHVGGYSDLQRKVLAP